jgi:hypothetical protein
MLANFRSRLYDLPEDVRRGLDEVSYQIGMTPSARKERAMNVLTSHNVPFKDIGTGTNRWIIRFEGFAVKIALDKEGIADNKQEWVMSSLLAPHVAPAHEISKGGHLLVASYAPAFSSYSEFLMWRQTIAAILADWGGRYLLGDVGITQINYANWGMLNGKPVCIDYAYIFPVSMDVFTCVCGNKEMAFTDNTFTEYRCTNPECKMTYTDRDLRAKISQQERFDLFKNVSENAIAMSSPSRKVDVPAYFTEKDLDPDRPDPYQIAASIGMSEGIIPPTW